MARDMVQARSVRIRRAVAQLLCGPGAATPEEVVARLLAVQAQDLRAARLALRARSQGLTAAAVDRALTFDRSLVVGWLGRGTLHLVCAADYPWLLALTAPARASGSRRRLGQEGVSPDGAERGLRVVARALAREGPLTRGELAERLAGTGIRTEGQATPHLLGLAARRGIAVLGPLRDGKQAFVLAEEWLGTPVPARLSESGRLAALAELAGRYLASHGPAAAADLATWAGLALRDVRAGLRSIADELIEVGGGLVDLAARDPAPDAVPPKLLAPFDPYLLGWRERGFAVPTAHARRVHPGGGVVRAAAVVDGTVVGTWTARRQDGRLALDVDLFSRLGPDAARALRAEAADVARFEGLALAS